MTAQGKQAYPLLATWFVCLYRLHYRLLRHALQGLLDAIPHLPTRLGGLIRFHEFTGFVKDDLSRAEPFRFCHPGGSFLLALFNPWRRERFKGAGLKAPPDGIVSRFAGCFLASWNVFWQQSARQFPYVVQLNSRLYCWLVQPFPFGSGHCTLAAARRRPQDWRRSGLRALREMITDIYVLAEKLGSRYLTLFNGVDAGASIPAWFHLHVLLPAGWLPIQEAARAAGAPTSTSVFRIDRPFWPLLAYRVTGPCEYVVEQIVQLASKWETVAGGLATECISAVVEDRNVVFYYVPRQRDRNRPRSGFVGIVGAYESAAGVFIFTEDDEGRELRDGLKDFENLWQILTDVRPEFGDEFNPLSSAVHQNR